MNRFELAEHIIDLDDRPISFSGRSYLKDIYNCSSDVTVLRFSRQTEKSTTLAIRIALTALLEPQSRILVVLPRDDQLKVFRDTRLMPVLRSSVIKHLLLGKRSDHSARFIQCLSGSQIYLRSAFHSADSARGLSVTHLYLDEYQDLAPNVLPVLTAAMSHTEKPFTILAGTPKSADNALEIAYNQSTQCEWETKCESCGLSNGPVEKTIGLDRLICINCAHPLDFSKGEWVSKNPGARRSGFWLNYLVTPWHRHDELLTFQKDFDHIQFKNEYLGLSSQLGDQLVTQEATEACCSADSMCNSHGELACHDLVAHTLVLGIDWGGGVNSRTAFVLGAHDRDSKFRVLWMERMPIEEDPEAALKRAAEIVQLMNIRFIAADGRGNGLQLNRQLLKKMNDPYINLHALTYVNNEQMPEPNGSITKWSIDRSAAIADVFTRIRTKDVIFPVLHQCQEFLKEIWRQTAEFDKEHRKMRYMCPPGSTDDILHAATYSMKLSTKLRSSIFCE